MSFIQDFKKQRRQSPFVIQEGRIGKLNTSRAREWAESSFLATTKKINASLSKNFSFSQYKILGLIIFSFIFLILTRTAWLQIEKGDYYYQMAEGNRIRLERVEAKRGIIYDRQGQALVRNAANFMLYLVPADLPTNPKEKKELIHNLAQIVQSIDEIEINKQLSKIKPYSLESYQPLFVVDNIAYEQAILLKIKADLWPGVVLSNKTRRAYNLPAPSLSHILGYTGKINAQELKEYGSQYLPIDYVGKMGVEYFWENQLRGINGQKQIEVDALGKEKKIISQTPAHDGYNLILAIDSRTQAKLEEIMRQWLKKLHLRRAAGVVLDPNNGEVLALVSLPAYDNNAFARGISKGEYQALLSDSDKPLFNRAISGEYPSGSTIKPVMAAAALEEGIISEYTSFLSTGGLRIGKWFFPDWRTGGHGTTDVRKAIAQSVNPFFYYIGGGYKDFRGLGPDRIVYYDSLFGLGKQTGIDLPGEASGFLPTRIWKKEVKGEPWYIGDTYHLSIGQGDLLVTPLQVAMFTSVFANGGALYRPHIVKQILDSDNKPVATIKEEPVRVGFIKPYNIEVVRQGMRQAVTQGSARRLQSVGVEVAGKTGTAQWSSKKKPHAWFTGFAPYKNPKIVITILVEEGGEGSFVSVPIAGEFLQWYFGNNS
jgi:penicillin-binding protein 2